MARPGAEKCRFCSNLTAVEAHARHGSQGTSCWDDHFCYQRRSYYRHRDHYNRQWRL